MNFIFKYNLSINFKFMGDYKIYNHVLQTELKNNDGIFNNNFFLKSNLSENFISNKLNILDIQSNFVYHNKN